MTADVAKIAPSQVDIEAPTTPIITIKPMKNGACSAANVGNTMRVVGDLAKHRRRHQARKAGGDARHDRQHAGVVAGAPGGGAAAGGKHALHEVQRHRVAER